MTEWDSLYRELGRRIREARELMGEKLSQEKLARRLNLSRASIVNIEAGRQHAPLHLLWQISEVLGTDLALLIPRRADLMLPTNPAPLDAEMVKQIQEAAKGDPEVVNLLTGMAGKLKASIESRRQSRRSNATDKSRN